MESQGHLSLKKKKKRKIRGGGWVNGKEGKPAHSQHRAAPTTPPMAISENLRWERVVF